MGVSCPACGRPVAVRHSPSCVYCGAGLLAPDTTAAGEDPLAARVRACFVLLARCRTGGDLAPALPWLAPDLAQRFEQEIDEDRRSQVHHVIDHATVGAIDVAAETTGERTVRIEALYAEYWQDERSHMIVRGLRGAKPHRQTWQLRKSEDEAVLRDRCPGCGADLGVRIDVRCPYCGLVPRINRLGWSVTAITTYEPDWAEWKRLAAEHDRLGPEVSAFWDALAEILRSS